MKQTLNLENILPKCDLANGEKRLNDSFCKLGYEPLDCNHKLYFNDVCFCKYEAIYNKAKQIEFAQWMER